MFSSIDKYNYQQNQIMATIIISMHLSLKSVGIESRLTILTIEQGHNCDFMTLECH